MAPCEPATDSANDAKATAYADAVFNRLFLQPLLTGAYPAPFLASIPLPALGIVDGDMARAHVPLDFIGVNCYYRLVVSTGGDHRPDLPYFLFDVLSDERSTGGHADLSEGDPTAMRIENAFGRSDGQRTAMGWEIWPHALRDVLLSLTREYGAIPIEVCESGCAFDEVPGADGRVVDLARIAYHDAHLRAVAEARRAGANVQSYHAWSLYDNFEWASGYRPRFGLVAVDYHTQQRTLKASAHWYRDVCRAAAGNLDPATG